MGEREAGGGGGGGGGQQTSDPKERPERDSRLVIQRKGQKETAD